MLSASAIGSCEEPKLSFLVGSEVRSTLTLSQLKGKAAGRVVDLYDSRYGKTKSFRCFPIAEVMAAGFGRDWQKLEETEGILKALDGYASVVSASRLREDGGCLAYEDVDHKDWELVGRKQVSPAPFYLIWQEEHQTPANAYPWPYQLASIQLVRFEERYPEVMPAGTRHGSPEHRGFKIFKDQCMRCHSINQQGGKIGPDLNAPRSVVDYRDKKTLLEFIRKPSDFRYTEMPDHEHLSDRDLEDLYDYFSLKSRESKP